MLGILRGALPGYTLLPLQGTRKQGFRHRGRQSRFELNPGAFHTDSKAAQLAPYRRHA